MHIKKLVRFFNGEQDAYGMPSIYHAYIVIGRAGNPGETTQGHGVAKVYTLSTQAPALNSDIVTAAGGAVGAISEAVQRLKKLNSGLTFNEQPESALP